MKPGPKRTPTPDLKIRGSRWANRPGEPESDGLVPQCPDWLVDPVAVAEWERLVPTLEDRGILDSGMDAQSLAWYCQVFADLLSAQRDISENGIMYVTDKGNEVQRPAVGVRNKLLAELRQFQSEFGLTPSARAGLNVQPKQKPQVKVRSRA